MPEKLELPCVKCGNAAVALDLRGLVALVPAKFMAAAKGAARLSGQKIDTERVDLGFPVADMAGALGVECIDCVDKPGLTIVTVDAETLASLADHIAVDNNPELRK